MKIEELKAEVEKYREGLKGKSGATCKFSDSGPVGMVLIDALVKVVEGLQSQIVAMGAKPNVAPIESLRAAMDREEKHLETSGGIMVAGPTGPVSVHPIRAIVAVVESLAADIEKLKTEIRTPVK